MKAEFSHSREMTEMLKRHDSVIVTPVSDSMYPLIRENRDSVVLGKPRFPLKKNDVALYENAKGKLILHRVVEARGHEYVFCGDHYVQCEAGIGDDRVCALMTGFFHKDKYTSVNSWRYRAYVFLWCSNFVMRRLAVRVWALIKRLTGAMRAPF